MPTVHFLSVINRRDIHGIAQEVEALFQKDPAVKAIFWRAPYDYDAYLCAIKENNDLIARISRGESTPFIHADPPSKKPRGQIPYLLSSRYTIALVGKGDPGQLVKKISQFLGV